MRPSRKTEVLWAIGMNSLGVTRRTLTQRFPKKTLDRHLKTCIREGMVERILEPRLKGERGRQHTKYRLLDCVFAVKIPCKILTRIKNGVVVRRSWFPGKRISRLSNSQVRLTGRYLEECKRALKEAWFTLIFPFKLVPIWREHVKKDHSLFKQNPRWRDYGLFKTLIEGQKLEDSGFAGLGWEILVQDQ